jgi:hypothetical protein
MNYEKGFNFQVLVYVVERRTHFFPPFVLDLGIVILVLLLHAAALQIWVPLANQGIALEE